jgi:hypothetical protein
VAGYPNTIEKVRNTITHAINGEFCTTSKQWKSYGIPSKNISIEEANAILKNSVKITGVTTSGTRIKIDHYNELFQ